MTRINVYITNPQYQELERIRNRLDIKPSESIRRALDMYIEDLKKKKKIK